MQFVNEQDRFAAFQLVNDAFHALFKLAAINRPRDERSDVELHDALVEQRSRHIALHDLLRESFDNRRLADAGFTDERWVILRTPRENLNHAFRFLSAARPLDRVCFVLRAMSNRLRVDQSAASLNRSFSCRPP